MSIRVDTCPGIAVAGMLLAAISMFSACRPSEQNSGSTAVSTQHAPKARTLGAAPGFVLPTMAEGDFSLAEHVGKVVVVNFWATWCAPCLEEIPEFIRLQDTFGDDGLQFVGISVDDEGPDAVAAFAERLGINYPVAMDDGEVAQSYKGHLVIPSTFVIGRDGLIRSRYIGVVTFATLVPEIKVLLEEDPPI